MHENGTGGLGRKRNSYCVLASRTDPQRLSTPTRMASSPMIVQAKGQPAVIVPTTTQTPKAIIPAEIRNESTISMIGPPFFRAQTIDGVEFEYIPRSLCRP